MPAARRPGPRPRPWLGLAGWPIGVDELAPWYLRAQALCELGPEATDPAAPWFERAGRQPLPLDPRRFSTRVFRYSPPTDFGKTHLPALRAGGVDLFLHATATALEPDEGGRRVIGVAVRPLPGREITIAARLVVLAAGGIENARLLLASDRVRPHGLGNERDQVGRCFMEHLFFDDVARLEPAGAWPQLGLYSRRHRVGGRAIKATLAPGALVQEDGGLLNCCFKLADPAKAQPGLRAAMDLRDWLRTGHSRAHVGRALRTLIADAPGAAGALLQLWRGGDPAAGERSRPLLISVTSEQLPDPDSRVSLSGERDALGQRLARLDWRLGEADRTSWARALELLAGDLAAAGIGRLTLPGPDGRALAVERVRGGCHHIGTTRMADAPAQGVVDRDARVHGIDNLYVAGSSVFPSAGHANPTLTLLALALRLADHLGARWRRESGADPAARPSAQPTPSLRASRTRAGAGRGRFRGRCGAPGGPAIR